MNNPMTVIIYNSETEDFIQFDSSDINAFDYLMGLRGYVVESVQSGLKL